MDNYIDITIDLETTSLSSHAAIMQIAAVAWDRFSEDAEHMFLAKAETETSFVRRPEEAECFCINVDLNSQFIEGLWDFSQSTSQWWGKRADAAKRAVDNHADITRGDWFQYSSCVFKKVDRKPLNQALMDLDKWTGDLLRRKEARMAGLWCQGTDFDIPVLRYAAECCNLPNVMPEHKYFRDCRTAVYEGVAAWLGRPDTDSPYSRLDLLNDPLLAYGILPALPGTFGSRENSHGALYDAVRSSWFTWQALRLSR